MKREFYTCEGRIYCLSDSGNHEITEKDNDLIDEFIERISSFYPAAYEELQRIYSRSAVNVPYYRFLMVRRFIKCNFGDLDTTRFDDVGNGAFHFEKTKCPMRGECKQERIICMPDFDSKLSKAELRVMELYYRNENVDNIADALYLSGCTVKNHIKSAYAKLGVHSQGEFITYANKHHLFD